MKKTKKEFSKFAQARGYVSHYSGKLKRHFLRKIPNFNIDIHSLINQNQPLNEVNRTVKQKL